jgi:flavin-binding protein dodecin
MAESVYRVTELVGTSTESWEKAAQVAIETASSSLRDLRIAEVVRLDLTVENGKVARFRTRLNVSFKIRERVAALASSLRQSSLTGGLISSLCRGARLLASGTRLCAAGLGIRRRVLDAVETPRRPDRGP